MKYLLLIMSILLCTSSFAQQFYNNVDLEGVDSVIVRAPVPVKLSQGNQPSILIRGTELFTDSIEIKKMDNVLTMSLKRNAFQRAVKDDDFNITYVKQAAIEVVLPMYKKIRIEGIGKTFLDNLDTQKTLTIKNTSSAKIFAQSIKASTLRVESLGSGDLRVRSITADKLKVSNKGSGDCYFSEIKAETIDIQSLGSGDCKVLAKSRTNTLKIESMGSGDLHLEPLISGVAKVASMGSGDLQLSVERKFNVESMGSGDIKYSGPANVKANIIGSGELTQITSKLED